MILSNGIIIWLNYFYTGVAAWRFFVTKIDFDLSYGFSKISFYIYHKVIIDILYTVSIFLCTLSLVTWKFYVTSNIDVSVVAIFYGHFYLHVFPFDLS